MYKNLRERKIDTIIKSIIKKYNERKSINDSFITVKKTPNENNQFKKIYLQPLIEAEFLIDESVILEFGGFGISLALGEFNYFMNRIMEYPLQEKPEELNINFFENIVNNYPSGESSAIIASLSFVYKNMLKENMVKWDNKLDCFVLNSRFSPIPIFTALDKIIENNIFIINKKFASWTYKEFSNKETISVKIGESRDDDKVDIYIKSEVIFSPSDDSLIFRTTY